MKAKLLFRRRLTYPDGGFSEFVAWKIPANPGCPDGIRYRFAFIPRGGASPAVLFDNHHPKGHHKHLSGRECRLEFTDLQNLIEEFGADVERWRTKER